VTEEAHIGDPGEDLSIPNGRLMSLFNIGHDRADSAVKIIAQRTG
jgi:hypothetical protein